MKYHLKGRRRIDSILEDQKRREENPSITDEVLDTLAGIDFKSGIKLFFEFIYHSLLIIIRPILRLLNWVVQNGYNQRTFFGPATLDEIYKHFNLTPEDIKDIEGDYEIKTKDASYIALRYQFISEFNYDKKHSEHFYFFCSEIDSFLIMGSLCKFEHIKLDEFRITFMIIYIDKKNKKLVDTVSAMGSSTITPFGASYTAI